MQRWGPCGPCLMVIASCLDKPDPLPLCTVNTMWVSEARMKTRTVENWNTLPHLVRLTWPDYHQVAGMRIMNGPVSLSLFGRERVLVFRALCYALNVEK